MNELKACPFCGCDTPYYTGGIRPMKIKCPVCDAEHKSDNDWDSRPLEDALRDRAEAAEKRVAELEAVIRGMFPMWINAMGYCEHGRKDQLVAMRNYYNGRDNPLTSEDIHLMFSLIPDKEEK